MPRHYSDRQRSAAEIIAVHFCSDTGEVRATVYEPTRFRNPSIYMWGEDYYCCPRSRQKLPKHHRDYVDAWDWQPVATYHGRTIYRAKRPQVWPMRPLGQSEEPTALCLQPRPGSVLK